MLALVSHRSTQYANGEGRTLGVVGFLLGSIDLAILLHLDQLGRLLFCNGLGVLLD